MSSRRWNEDLTVWKDDNPVLEFVFLKEDDTTVRDLTGYHGWVSFWYPDIDVHVERAGLVDVAAMVLRYACRGDEFTTVGQCLSRATICPKDLADGIDRAYFTVSFPVTRWTVLAKP